MKWNEIEVKRMRQEDEAKGNDRKYHTSYSLHLRTQVFFQAQNGHATTTCAMPNSHAKASVAKRELELTVVVTQLSGCARSVSGNTAKVALQRILQLTELRQSHFSNFAEAPKRDKEKS